MGTASSALHKGKELSCICQVPGISNNLKMLLRAIVHSDFAKSSLLKRNTKEQKEYSHWETIFSNKLVKGMSHKTTRLVSPFHLPSVVQVLFVTHPSQTSSHESLLAPSPHDLISGPEGTAKQHQMAIGGYPDRHQGSFT